MLSNDHLETQHVQQRPGCANNLPGALANKPGWRHPVMAAAKLICWRFALLRAGSEDRLVDRTDWRKVGLTRRALLEEVRKILPCFDEAWAEQGRVDSEKAKMNALYGRLWHMYRERDAKGKVTQTITVEHPTRSERLKPYREAARKVFAEGKPLTHTQIMELFN